MDAITHQCHKGNTWFLRVTCSFGRASADPSTATSRSYGIPFRKPWDDSTTHELTDYVMEQVRNFFETSGLAMGTLVLHKAVFVTTATRHCTECGKMAGKTMVATFSVGEHAEVRNATLTESLERILSVMNKDVYQQLCAQRPLWCPAAN
ncbi:MAG: hypothetical protein CO141_01245 [Candidatus Moranbacteria bacterium CG_4_9_14_3_um_filter_42_9]|nr:MAG: hypothetical protein CO141_01245 [Candidatus Moranbacteria bacterium CG_4_9_14_3_um_filter_42_9]